MFAALRFVPVYLFFAICSGQIILLVLLSGWGQLLCLPAP
jgi:hypothetical protein